MNCRCNCGYTCGGPEVCPVFGENPGKCMEDHHRFDCDHNWNGPITSVTVFGCDSESETCSVKLLRCSTI